MTQAWRAALTSTMLDCGRIERAFSWHFYRLRLEERECVFHRSWESAVEWLILHNEKQFVDDLWLAATGLAWQLDPHETTKSFYETWAEANYTFGDVSAFPALQIMRDELIRTLEWKTSSSWKSLLDICWVRAEDLLGQASAVYGEYGNPWTPLVRAFANGVFFFWVTQDAVHVLLRPMISTDAEDRLHGEAKPAVHWSDGPRLYFWHGVRVPEQIVMRPETLDPEEILQERNLEVRRIMIERFGMDRLVRERGKQLDVSPQGTLYHLKFSEEREPRVIVEVRCPSTGRNYLLRVPPSIRGVHRAIAWTFSLHARDYQPIQET